ncbi:PadR family transcriptional regulator [uncultured Cohaesibacter sp.]|uniref:PadR family transcriptional regulator n=1 Tax=uncultured Cohaesibacter sp. TaxID=1002546 RepID=UPI0029C7FD27|nr:PadR family transcriptional regulator [uncultured Cohaesibacter sp.]
MNVRSICLAILYCSDRTGYDIRKFSTEGNFSFFIDASYGSIYPALNKLETEGLVTCRHVAEEGKPARKVYSITESGRRALFEELLQPHRPDIYKSEFLLISLFARLIGPEAIREAIDRQVQQLNEELALISSCNESELQTDLEPSDCGRNELDLQAAEWAKSYGLYCVQASIDYLKMHGEALVEIARQGNQTEPQAQTGLSE